jgi:TIR domain
LGGAVTGTAPALPNRPNPVEPVGKSTNELGGRISTDVFVSYSSVDKSVAERLCNLLEAAGVTCWIAPRDIKPATDWPTAIKYGIRSSAIFLLLASDHSLNSREVEREVLLADQEHRPLLTVRIDDSEVPDSLAYFLNRVQWIKWKEGDWATVVHAVFSALDRESPPSISSPPLWDSPELQQSRHRRTPMDRRVSTVGTERSGRLRRRTRPHGNRGWDGRPPHSSVW